MTKPIPYDDDTIAARLRETLPGWALVDGAIRRTVATAGWKASLMVATTIGHLAEAAWHHPDLHVGYGGVTVILSTHSAQGVTDLDFALAAKIDEVLGWRPAPPFTGTPRDPRHAYLVHDTYGDRDA